MSPSTTIHNNLHHFSGNEQRALAARFRCLGSGVWIGLSLQEPLHKLLTWKVTGGPWLGQKDQPKDPNDEKSQHDDQTVHG